VRRRKANLTLEIRSSTKLVTTTIVATMDRSDPVLRTLTPKWPGVAIAPWGMRIKLPLGKIRSLRCLELQKLAPLGGQTELWLSGESWDSPSSLAPR
jgi:hypothetical protein